MAAGAAASGAANGIRLKKKIGKKIQMTGMAGMTQDFFKRFAVRPKDRQGRAYTHTFFTGGSFIVPSHEDDNARMFTAIERDIKANIPIFINEIASGIFRMFLDLDFQLSQRLSDADIGIIVKQTYDALRRFYVQNDEQRNPRLFEAIVLGNDSPSLCSNALHLQTLLEEIPEFTSDDVVNVLTNGDVGIKNSNDHNRVDWKYDKYPPPGSYQCSVNDGIVTILAASAYSFNNRLVMNKTLASVLVRGIPPANSVDAYSAKDRIGPWLHAFDTIFKVSDDSYFVNTKRDMTTHRLKQGLHIIFPEMGVNIEQALYIREALIEALTVKLGKDLAPDGWSSVIDNSVYATGKGLRMIGSNKASQCPRCKGIKSEVKCQSCIYGKIDEGRPYVLHSIYEDGIRNVDMEQKYRSNLSYQIKRSSIRTNMAQPTPGWTLYVGCPKFGNMLETNVKDGETTYKIVSREAIFKTDKGGTKRSRGAMTIIDNPEIFAMFERYIRKRFIKQYSQLRVTKITKTDSIYFISVAGEGQHYCLNKIPPSEHTSNTIYFQCDRDGLCVRCHCPKPFTENRAKVECKKFKSTYISLDVKDMANLFGDTLSMKVGGETYLGLSNETASKLTKTQLGGSSRS